MLNIPRKTDTIFGQLFKVIDRCRIERDTSKVGMCDCVRECRFYNVVVYNICRFHIVHLCLLFSLLLVCIKLPRCWYKCDLYKICVIHNVILLGVV